jgi:hypothetical protein
MKVYCEWEGCLFYQFSTVFNSLHSTYWPCDKLFRIMDGPKDRPFSYTKKQCSAIQWRLWELQVCGSVICSRRNLYKLAVLEGSHFPYLPGWWGQQRNGIVPCGTCERSTNKWHVSMWNMCFACNPHPINLWGGGGGLKRSLKNLLQCKF